MGLLKIKANATVEPRLQAHATCNFQAGREAGLMAHKACKEVSKVSGGFRPIDIMRELCLIRPGTGPQGPYKVLEDIIRPYSDLIRPSRALQCPQGPYKTLKGLIRPLRAL